MRDLATGHTTTLIRGGSQAEYVAPGFLVYAVAGTLRAVRFDPTTLTVGSDPVPVVEAVTTLPTGAAEFSVSRTGALVYVPGGATSGTRSLVWVTRQGHEEILAAAPPRNYFYPRLSPDGTRVVSAGTPTTLFETQYFNSAAGRPYDVSPDGQRFLMIKNNTGTDQAASMVVVLNWLQELKAKLPTK